MARYRDAKCRLCRREGQKLFLKGARCFTDKCAIERRNYPRPARLNRGKLTPYGIQLREKQKAKRIYGVLESQFRKYFQWAEREKGVTGENLLRAARAAAGQRRPSAGLRRLAARVPPDGRPRPLRGQQPQGLGAVHAAEGRRRRAAALDLEDAARVDDNVNAGRGQLPQWLEVEPNERKGVVRSSRSAKTSRFPSANSSSSSCTASRSRPPMPRIPFQKPKKVEWEILSDRYGRLVAEPFEKGYALTVGTRSGARCCRSCRGRRCRG